MSYGVGLGLGLMLWLWLGKPHLVRDVLSLLFDLSEGVFTGDTLIGQLLDAGGVYQNLTCCRNRLLHKQYAVGEMQHII